MDGSGEERGRRGETGGGVNGKTDIGQCESGVNLERFLNCRQLSQ